MRRRFKATGILLGVIFTLATLLRFVEALSRGRPFLGLLLKWDSLLLIAATILMFLSAFRPRLAWIQPAIYLIFTPVTLIRSHDSFYGLGFFVVGLLLLFRLGFFERRKILKLSLALAYLYAWEIIGALRTGRGLLLAFTPVFFTTVFLLVLYLAFQEKIMVYLKEPKARISLEEKGLSEAEKSYVLALAKGKNVKEIALDYEVAESTIRNTISRAYQKLGVADKAAFATLVERFEIVG